MATGAAGGAWFLGHAAAAGLPGAAALRVVALDVARAAVVRASAALPAPGGLGLLDGATGVAVAACGLGRRLGDPELVRAGRMLAQRIAAASAGVERFALADGMAGICLGLLSLQDDDFRADRLDACAALGDRLLAAADVSAAGIGWPGTPPGLAHGAAGVGLALAHLAAATGRRRYGEGAAEAARLERTAGLPGAGWASGGDGIGLARLHGTAILGEAAQLADAGAAVARARLSLSGRVAGHPELGRGVAAQVELLLVAHEVTGADEHLRAARRAGVTMGRACAAAPPAGPGLVDGAAGVGMVALRLHDPALAPSPALFGVPPARMVPAR
ncbi:MAG: hypothetical protein MUE51_04995 [Thermoleophilia bacterium]|nr:hypothetical protein [Thermoleophilia bacterium]